MSVEVSFASPLYRAKLHELRIHQWLRGRVFEARDPIEERTRQVGPETEKEPVVSSHPPVMAFSPVGGAEKPGCCEDNVFVAEQKDVDEPQSPVEYPKGVDMFFIMLALVLSIVLFHGSGASCRFESLARSSSAHVTVRRY